MKKELEDIKKRLYRLETLAWILVAKMGIDGATELIPIITAMIK